MRSDPVIVLAMHRSGSTYLTRLLNAAPNLVVWGEHGGFLVGVRNSVSAARYRLAEGNQRDSVDRVKTEVQSRFIPFMNPFSGDDYAEGQRTLLTQMFSRNLPEGTRWGFKELRYLSTGMIDFLFDMWPNAQLVFNLRDPVDLCVSSLRASWVVERLQNGLKGYTPDKLDLVVFNTLVRIYTLERLSLYAQGKYGIDRVIQVWYEDLTENPTHAVQELFDFLKERNFSISHIEKTAEHIVGKALKFGPEQPEELDPTNIYKVATRLKRDAYDLNFARHKVDPKWDFCVGVMPGDQVAFDFNIVS